MVNGDALMRRPDPSISAGHVICPACAAVAYPSDACWLNDALVIATFPSVCTHVPEAMRVVSPVMLPLDRRCQAMTVAGNRCKLPVVLSGWCAVHLRDCSPGPHERDQGDQESSSDVTPVWKGSRASPTSGSKGEVSRPHGR